MIGTSGMFGAIAQPTFGKALRGKLRYSGSMKGTQSAADNARADYMNVDVTRDFMTRAYEVNEWIRAIVDLTVERACQVEMFPMPINVSRDAAKISDDTKRHMETLARLQLRPNKDNESFYDLKKKVFKDIKIYDEAGMQIVKNSSYSSDNQDVSLWANVTGEELFVNPRKDGTLRATNTYVQIRNQEIVGTFNKMNFMNFIHNRRAGYANGFSPISTVALSILGDFEMVNYNYKFFENNARPNIAFIFEQLGFGKGQGALERAKAWYNQEHAGKPHLPLFMGAEKGNVKMVEMKTTHKDMEFTDWELLLLSRMMAVYGMQPMVLGVLTDTTGKLNSEVQTEQFKRNAIIPLIKMFLNTFNATLVWGNSNLNYDDIYLTSTNLDIDDEKKQAEIDETYLDRGVITINQIRHRLQMPSVDWGDEPFVPLNYAPLSLLQEFQEARIRDSATKAQSDGVDNNAKIADMDRTQLQIRHMMKNFKVPTGLEKVDPAIIMEVATNLIKERDRFLNKTYSFPTHFRSDTLGVVGAYGLNMKKVLRKSL